eukprot:356232-Chlamydomonas_euryale.AAC.12
MLPRSDAPETHTHAGAHVVLMPHGDVAHPHSRVAQNDRKGGGLLQAGGSVVPRPLKYAGLR